MLLGAAAWREIGAVLQRLELRLGERVVVGDVRPRVALGDREVGQQEGHRLGCHRRTAISVQGELVRRDAVAPAGLVDERLRDRGAFPCGQRPADDVAAEDVEDHVQVEVGPLGRSE